MGICTAGCKQFLKVWHEFLPRTTVSFQDCPQLRKPGHGLLQQLDRDRNDVRLLADAFRSLVPIMSRIFSKLSLSQENPSFANIPILEIHVVTSQVPSTNESNSRGGN